MNGNIRLPPALSPGDTVRLVSPASTPSRDGVAQSAATLEALGFKVELGKHVFDRLGYLAGSDEDRLADINDALRDRAVRALVATSGGKGAYRIADKLDFAALRLDPKPVVGFSEITNLHLAIWKHCRVPGIHGAAWNAEQFGPAPAESFQRVLTTADPVTVRSSPHEATSELTTHGVAEGVLLGGNLDSIAGTAGWALPDLDGAILLIEDVEKGLGHIDRHLTRLINAGHLRGVRGVAVGQFTGFKAGNSGWTIIDLLRDRLGQLGVPILGGLPLGHGDNPVAIPVGTPALLDCGAGALTISSGVM
jgi:muramoyltetrapeptide carboxypeptidase